MHTYRRGQRVTLRGFGPGMILGPLHAWGAQRARYSVRLDAGGTRDVAEEAICEAGPPPVYQVGDAVTVKLGAGVVVGRELDDDDDFKYTIEVPGRGEPRYTQVYASQFTS